MTWAALTSPVDRCSRDGKYLRFPIVDEETIYKGDMVRINADGEATSTGAPAQYDMFVGVALETVDNTDDGEYVTVATRGVFSFTKDTPAQTDAGCLAYIDPTGNQQTVVLSAGTGAGSGIIVGGVIGPDPNAATNLLVMLRPMLSVGAGA